MSAFDELPGSKAAALIIEFQDVCRRGLVTFNIASRTTTFELKTYSDVEFVRRYLSLRGLKFTVTERTIVMNAEAPS